MTAEVRQAERPRRVLFLFGAGASFGAGGILPEAPPLGGRLFGRLADLHPNSWGRLPADVAAEFVGDFEVGMATVFRRFGTAIPELMREMAIFFAQFRPFQRSSLYCRLIQDLKAAGLLDHVSFATLNYECVLEFSILDHGVNIAYFDSGKSGTVPVRKLHGSCNMFSRQVKATRDITYGTGVSFEGSIEAFLDTNVVIEKCLVGTGLAPVMCLYMVGKPLSVSPSSIHAVQELWAQEVAACEAVICVGARTNPTDSHIWKPLAETTGTLYFVGSKAEFSAWHSEARTNKTEFLGERFASAYHEILAAVDHHAA